ncbi:hypothetical protein D3C76_1346650 [compost metagenome]
MTVNVYHVICCIIVAIIRILTIPESIAGITEVHMHTHINNVHTRELTVIWSMIIVAIHECIGRCRLISCAHHRIFVLIHF